MQSGYPYLLLSTVMRIRDYERPLPTSGKRQVVCLLPKLVDIYKIDEGHAMICVQVYELHTIIMKRDLTFRYLPRPWEESTSPRKIRASWDDPEQRYRLDVAMGYDDPRKNMPHVLLILAAAELSEAVEESTLHVLAEAAGAGAVINLTSRLNR